ncbi:hypothetical protein SKAU_G00200710 [Synaphobranchus kaupii]|uniref:Uncharacterized protein n=1 Tax=Synaphobranchus kaupii TaxID=118154 RepID=A0A9Q1IW25_SYNKA|nr:hypothetical protein SKAU_G00200710 [Synaphobranchus kaupii]
MAETLRKSFHILAFVWYAFVMLSFAAKDGEPLPAGIFLYGGPWKYLTFLNLILQMVFFGLATACDFEFLFGKDMAKQLNLCKNLLFSVFAFPVGMHTLVLPFLLGETLLQPHAYPKTKSGLAALGIAGLVYLSCTPGLVGFFFCNMSIVALLYVLGQTLNKQVWGLRIIRGECATTGDLFQCRGDISHAMPMSACGSID